MATTNEQPTWRVELTGCSRWPGSGHREVGLRLTTTGTDHAAQIDAQTTPRPGADQAELLAKVLAMLADNADWQRLGVIRGQLETAERAEQLARARADEASAALRACQLSPADAKGWAGKLGAAEKAQGETRAALAEAAATLASIRRAAGAAAATVRDAVKQACTAARLAIATDRGQRLERAIAAAGQALAPVLGELVAAEQAIRPLMDAPRLAEELLAQATFGLDNQTEDDGGTDRD